MSTNKTNQTNKTTELSTINQNALACCDVNKVEAIENAALRGETINLVNLVGADVSKQYEAASEVDKLRKQQGEILFRVEKSKLFEKGGFKNMTEYADSIGLPKDVKSRISQMKTAGEVICDKDAPEALKRLPYTVIGQMGAIIHDKDAYKALKEEAKNPDFRITQEEAKDRARVLREAKNPTVVPTYGAMVNGVYIKQDGNNLYQTIEEWEHFFAGEVIRLPKSKSGDIRYLSIVDGVKLTMYTLHKRENESKNHNVPAAPVMTIEAMAQFLGVSVDQLTALKANHA